jgi:hypothetical protein
MEEFIRRPMNLKGNQNIIPLLAMVVLIIGSVSTIYVHANQSVHNYESESIIINNHSFEITTIFDIYSNITIETDIGEKTGISLSEILLSTEIDCPSCHSYTIKATDGYQQTVNWDDIQQGILTIEKSTYFPHLAHAFWVKDIKEIEVKETL